MYAFANENRWGLGYSPRQLPPMQFYAESQGAHMHHLLVSDQRAMDTGPLARLIPVEIARET